MFSLRHPCQRRYRTLIKRIQGGYAGEMDTERVFNGYGGTTG